MKNDLAYAHGLDWDEINEQSCPFQWEQIDEEEPDDYFYEEEDDLDDDEL